MSNSAMKNLVSSRQEPSRPISEILSEVNQTRQKRKHKRRTRNPGIIYLNETKTISWEDLNSQVDLSEKATTPKKKRHHSTTKKTSKQIYPLQAVYQLGGDPFTASMDYIYHKSFGNRDVNGLLRNIYKVIDESEYPPFILSRKGAALHSGHYSVERFWGLGPDKVHGVFTKKKGEKLYVLQAAFEEIDLAKAMCDDEADGAANHSSLITSINGYEDYALQAATYQDMKQRGFHYFRQS